LSIYYKQFVDYFSKKCYYYDDFESISEVKIFMEEKNIYAKDDEKLKIMGERLKLLRGLRFQNAVAVDLKLKPQVLAYYENGKRHPDFKTLCAIANYYNTTVDYLIGNSDFRNIQDEATYYKHIFLTIFNQKARKKMKRLPKDQLDFFNQLLSLSAFWKLIIELHRYYKWFDVKGMIPLTKILGVPQKDILKLYVNQRTAKLLNELEKMGREV